DCSPTCHRAGSPSGSVTVKAAGGPMRVVSAPAMRLFQPIVTALLYCELPSVGVLAVRSARRLSRHVDALSALSATPSMLPDARSMSSSNAANGRNVLSWKRVMYIVGGSQ